MEPATILIPGIKGTTLVDSNSLDFDKVYSFSSKLFSDLKKLKLNADANDDNELLPIIERNDVEDLAYEDIVDFLQTDCKTNVFIFGYDWRYSNMITAKRLVNYVDRLKKKLNINKFNFVTHSMGGLVFMAYLKLLKPNDPNYDTINKAIIAACPFKGSIDSVVALVKGEGGINFPLLNSNDRFREIARTFPSVYELLPSYDNAVCFGDNQTNQRKTCNIFDWEIWQDNLKKNEIMKKRIDDAKKFHDEISSVLKGLENKILVIAGTNESTMNKLEIVTSENTKHFFNFDTPKGDGDGTVPIQSSTFYKNDLLTLKVESKWYDRATHSFFLKDGRVQDLICLFLSGKTQAPKWWENVAGTVSKVV